MVGTASELVAGFQRRLVSDLVVNNVLRGAWAEEVVAHWLGLTDFPGQWSYYDLRDVDGTTISVKHSTGKAARFTVKRTKWAWDNELALARNGEGWRGGYEVESQLWCDVYDFAWLPEPIEVERILDPTLWQFTAASRADLYLSGSSPTFSLTRLANMRGMVAGERLREAVAEAKTSSPDGDVPLLDLSEAVGALPTPPVADS